MKVNPKKIFFAVFGVILILLGIVSGLLLLAFIALYNLAEYYMCIPGLLFEFFVFGFGGLITGGLVLGGLKVIKLTREES